MLNRVILMGRITHDLELKQTPSGVSVLTFSVAVERSYAKQGEEKQVDFISCVAWQKNSEFVSKYFAKGRMIALEGGLRSRTYDDKNGSKHYVTEVYVDNVSFTGEAKQNNYSSEYAAQRAADEEDNKRAMQALLDAQSGKSTSSIYSNQQISTGVGIGDLADYEDILSDDGVPF